MSASNHTEQILYKLTKLPKSSGCYLFKDANGEILYIGKATILKNRVRSYFQKSIQHSRRIKHMIDKICDLEWIVVSSEIEALILECNLIKKHRPTYNIRLKDDKSYPFIAITKEDFPRIYVTRNINPTKAKYFGPYTNTSSAREFVNILHKSFPLIPCGKSWDGKERQRPCIYYHMHQCLAPCAGLSDSNKYKNVINEVEKLLSGKNNSVVEKFHIEMQQAVENLEFEKAAVLRDKIFSIENLLSKQRVLSQNEIDKDVIAMVEENNTAAIQLLYIRGGRLVGQRRFYIDESVHSDQEESIGAFIKEYYNQTDEIPEEIIIQQNLQEKKVLEEWLKSKRNKSVKMTIPVKGEKKALLDMAIQNAHQAFNIHSTELQNKEAWAERAIDHLTSSLQLSEKLSRIECYDISNLQGTNPVASMVVNEQGFLAKHEYRRFKIKNCPETPNDFAMMHEVISRRLKAYLEKDKKFSTFPDLIVVDGGKGQLSSALHARDKLGLNIPIIIGLAKKEETIITANVIPNSGIEDQNGFTIYDYSFTEINLDLHSPGLLLLRRLRDEAHRFAISYHRKLRNKSSYRSEIDDIPGVGPVIRKRLFEHFESIKNIESATLQNIASIKGINKNVAEKVWNYFKSQNNSIKLK